MKFSRRNLALTSIAAPVLMNPTTSAQTSPGVPPDLEPAATRFAKLLECVPGGHLDGDPYITWNDYQRQVIAVREAQGDAVAELPDSELALMASYANIPQFLPNAMRLEEFTGYTMENLHQVIEFGTPPEIRLVARVNENPESLIPFWESVDYQEKENEFGSFWTIGEEGEMSLTHPVQRIAFSRLNNIAILDDATIAYAPTSELLGEIQATAVGDAPSAAAGLQPTITALPDDANSAWILDGEMLMFEGLVGSVALTENGLTQLEEIFESSNEAVGSMPVFRTVCTSVTAGASYNELVRDPEAREIIILETDAADAAKQAADVVIWRAENLDSLVANVPYREMLPNLEVQAVSPELVLCERELGEAPPRFSNMIITRDTLLFAYRVGD